MNDDCLFCRIIRQEIPSTDVLSTERSYAFRDLNPQAPTHVLVVPRGHIATADDITRAVVVLASDELSGHMTGELVTVAGGMEGRTLHL